jgi:hypothetical protein
MNAPALNRTQAICMARDALELLQEDPMGCMDHCDTIEDSMMEHQLSWNILGVSEKTYYDRTRDAAIRCTKEIYERITTTTQKRIWVEELERVMRRFDLDWKDVGIKRTDFLIQKRWFSEKASS